MTIARSKLFRVLLARAFGSFGAFVSQFFQDGVITNSFRDFSSLPTESRESRAMSKELKKRGFRFVGPTICYAFLQVTGFVNDHIVDCFRYDQIKRTEQRDQP
jgi:DNA-3-methyladenine glycosylase I